MPLLARTYYPRVVWARSRRVPPGPAGSRRVPWVFAGVGTHSPTEARAATLNACLSCVFMSRSRRKESARASVRSRNPDGSDYAAVRTWQVTDWASDNHEEQIDPRSEPVGTTHMPSDPFTFSVD